MQKHNPEYVLYFLLDYPVALALLVTLLQLDVAILQHFAATFHPNWFAQSGTIICFQQANDPKHTSDLCKTYLNKDCLLKRQGIN